MNKYVVFLISLCVGGQIWSMNIEVEVKMGLSSENQQKLELWLAHHALYKGTLHQVEDYLVNPLSAEWEYSHGFKDTMKTFRVRRTPKGHYVCHKYCHRDDQNRVTHRDEYETIVADADVVLAVFKALVPGLEVTHIEKVRKVYMYNDLEIVLDVIDELGSFVEIEVKSQVADIQSAHELIYSLLKMIGITEYREYSRSYVHMLWNPGYDFSTIRYLE